ncbi:hypothetical protein WA026_002522 [Henosepilachna vigintioctopunctata]|uniref:Ionotropic receptor n=1 Tax=Henosepilachna vigintioctopunctata TaxID=420089 RepID=A0AAW1TZX9_9CUCU
MVVVSNAEIIIFLNKVFLTYFNTSRSVAVINYNQEFLFPILRINATQIHTNNNFDSSIDWYIMDIHQNAVQEFFKFSKKLHNFNPRAGFIFIGHKITDKELQTLFVNFVINVVFIDSQSMDIWKLNLFQNVPFSKYPPSGYIKNKLGNVKDLNPKALFEDVIPKIWVESTFTSCFVHVEPYYFNKYEGIYPEILKLMMEMMNMEIRWVEDSLPIENDWELHYDKVLSERKCDIHMAYLMGTVECLIPYSFDTAFWFVPSPKEIERWKYVVKIFSLEVWVIWITTSILLCIIWRLTTKFTRKRYDDLYSTHNAFSNMFMIFLEQTPNLTAHLQSQKILILLMIFLTFLMNLFFKTKYAFLLLGTNFEASSINSFEDIMEKRMTIGIPGFFFKIFKNDDVFEEYFNSYYLPCPAGNTCINRTAYKRDIATIQVKRLYVSNRKYLVDENYRDLLQMIPRPVITNVINMVVKKGHPLVDQLNQNLHHLWDHGFVQKITSKYETDGFHVKYLQMKKLSLEHIKFPLGVLITGLIISAIVFFTK